MASRRLGSLVARRRRRTVVLALDGVSATELGEAIDNGTVPVLGRALGALRRIRPTFPSVSAVEWATFATASNPARHGIFGLLTPTADYGVRVGDSRELRMPTLWDRAATDGLQSVVINLPGTYPARQLAGRMVAGSAAPRLEDACHPRSLAERLKRDGYRVDVDLELADGPPDAFAAHLLEVSERRIDAIERMLEGSWALAVLGLTELDRLHHVWHDRLVAGDEGARVLRGAWLGGVDRLLGAILERHPSAHVIAVSGHGLGPLRRYLNLTRWLEEAGYLVRKDGTIGKASVALSLDGNLVYLNAKRIFSAGGLEDGSVAPIVEEIAAALRELVDPATGERPIAAVLHRRDVYSGPYYRVAPHLVCVPSSGYELASAQHLPVFSDAKFTGTHRPEEGFVAGAELTDAWEPTLEDAGATVLRWLGLYVDDIDGAPLA
jgi:predicted AlkP superfamily phosphohydrolase/phosphomutase